jgi:ABC-2 type transport system permease protein
MRKEIIQLRRDKRRLPMVLVAPVLQLVLLGYAATMDVVEARVVVVDNDRSPASRTLASHIRAADNLDIAGHAATIDDAMVWIENTTADLVLVIPTGMGRDLAQATPAKVQLIIDGSDAVAAGMGSAYVSSVVALFGAQISSQLANANGVELRLSSIEDRALVLYNKELKSRNFMVPAVLALILVVFTSLLTAMAIVREKETGTLEQLIVTPISPSALLLGKLIPFVAVGLIQSTLVVAVATLWFQVPLRGSLALLYGLILLFVVNTLAIGLFVSTISRTQQQAMMTVIFFFLMPMMFLSGFVFPIENMPIPIQKLTYIIPLRYFLTIVRGIFLKGSGWSELWDDALALAIIGATLFGAALLRFRKRLD